MAKRPIKENEFFGAPGGSSGTVNYQAPIGTHSSPNVSQDPDKFEDDKVNTVQGKALGQHSNTAKNVPNPADMANAVDQIYSKKKVPTADEVKAGLDFEIHNMIKPDKAKAKELVLKNLKRDPEYYGKLHHLNIDDKTMKVDLNETLKNVNVEETKKIFSDLANAKQTKYVVNSKIVDAMRETIAAKNKRRMWQIGDPTL